MAYCIPEEETLDRAGLETLQRRKLAALLSEVLATNPFYKNKLEHLRFDPASDPIESLPLTTRAEIERDQLDHPPYGTNLTYPLDRYRRQHQTSGSSGRPLRWLDTAESWDWFIRCWMMVFRAAGVRSDDRFVIPFSFGPFIGFWGAFEAAVAMENLTLPAGGMSTLARLHYIVDNDATVVCCTPTYAIRMAEVADEQGIDLTASAVRAIIVGGEPGASIPATRSRIESAWGARLFDHCGMTEIGAWGLEPEEARGGMNVIESEFIAEVIDPDSGSAVADGDSGELVLTNLGRVGSPLIRYRTGDQVRLTRNRPIAGRHFAWVDGGVLGRIDEMMIVRGNNVFPSAIEGILREFPEVAEFRLNLDRSRTMTDLSIEVEPTTAAEAGDLADRIIRVIRDRLLFKPVVKIVEPGALPRFEMKSRRVVRADG